MCSIVGYIGKNYSRAFILEGLRRLEYRGYDSTGFACLDPRDGRLLYLKSAGKLPDLIKKFGVTPIDGFVGVGHTRWATHGTAIESNAHPHFDCEKKLAIVHNGIVENHRDLRQELVAAGHEFLSETDTEVVAHLFEDLVRLHSHISDPREMLKSVVIQLMRRVEGAFAFLCILEQFPDVMVLVRKRSPLCVGVGQREMFVASDLMAFVHKCKQVMFLPDESFALVHDSGVSVYDFSGAPLSVETQTVSDDYEAQDKAGHEHFMLKEIYEQKDAISHTLDFLRTISPQVWDYVGLSVEQARALESISLIGCGTSWHSARIARFFFEGVCKIPTKVLLASEFDYKSLFPVNNSLFLAISQSGETADVLDVVRAANEHNYATAAITNVPASSLVREAGGFLLTQVGTQYSLAVTRSFSTQLVVLFWFAHRLALEKGLITQRAMITAECDLLVAAEALENSIESYKFDITQRIARTYAEYPRALFLGRGISYPFAMEAALKLTEISYIFSQCYPAGELKHGPFALVDDKTPVFVFSHQDPVIYKKLVANAQEVKARQGHVVAFAFAGQTELIDVADQVFVIPRVNPLLGPLAMTGLMQFLFYHVAKELDRPIDQPRNLARATLAS